MRFCKTKIKDKQALLQHTKFDVLQRRSGVLWLDAQNDQSCSSCAWFLSHIKLVSKHPFQVRPPLLCASPQSDKPLQTNLQKPRKRESRRHGGQISANPQ